MLSIKKGYMGRLECECCKSFYSSFFSDFHHLEDHKTNCHHCKNFVELKDFYSNICEKCDKIFCSKCCEKKNISYKFCKICKTHFCSLCNIKKKNHNCVLDDGE